MPTAWTWQFVALDVHPTEDGLTNVVDSVDWRLTGDDGLGHLVTVYGDQPLGPPDPGNFIPYNDLTAAIVQGWVEAQLGADLDVIKADVQGRIAQQISPNIVAMEPPWVT